MSHSSALPIQHEVAAPSPTTAQAARLDREADFALQFGAVTRAEWLAHRAAGLRSDAEAPR